MSITDWRSGAGGALVYWMSSGLSPEEDTARSTANPPINAEAHSVKARVRAPLENVAKPKDWRGVPGTSAMEGAPVLEFAAGVTPESPRSTVWICGSKSVDPQ